MIDKEKGNLVKADRFGYVKRAMHGTRMLSTQKVRCGSNFASLLIKYPCEWQHIFPKVSPSEWQHSFQTARDPREILSRTAL